ncbi:hypothetical protein Adt_33243 [Abeliophyllum distichum]|uniref:Uncharacterized protein n=1 Tax=Abeliophyllum distichum TaxID=126358 RepID=A0ABD1QWZ5_9LAMI
MDIAPLFGISLTTPSLLLHILVYWHTTLVESYKVNTDRCVKNRFSSGGRIIRDLLGQYVFAHSSLHIASALFWRLSSELFLTVSFLLKGLYSQIYRLSPTLLWPIIASPEVEDLGLFRPLFVTSDISLPSTVILFIIFIAKATRWLPYLLQKVGIVLTILSSVLRTYRDVIAA